MTKTLSKYGEQQLVMVNYACDFNQSETRKYSESIIEGFGGKRALGFLLKIELCRKRSKFRMQFCLGALNNVLYVFFAEVFFVYEISRMQKSLYLWSHQHVTGKTVISLKIQQNIDLLQRVTLKSVDFRIKPLQF